MLPPISSGDVRTLAATTGVHRSQRLALVLRAVTIGLVAVTLLVVARRGEGWARGVVDDLRYGMPRTAHLSARFGDEPDQAPPTQISVLNLNRQILLVEVPGGDASAARLIVGPYLFGERGDTLPVVPSAADLNGDGRLDLLLRVDREVVVYLRTEEGFALPTPEERGRLALPAGEAQP